jgi:hypothetical protein
LSEFTQTAERQQLTSPKGLLETMKVFKPSKRATASDHAVTAGPEARGTRGPGHGSRSESPETAESRGARFSRIAGSRGAAPRLGATRPPLLNSGARTSSAHIQQVVRITRSPTDTKTHAPTKSNTGPNYKHLARPPVILMRPFRVSLRARTPAPSPRQIQHRTLGFRRAL